MSVNVNMLTVNWCYTFNIYVYMDVIVLLLKYKTTRKATRPKRLRMMPLPVIQICLKRSHGDLDLWPPDSPKSIILCHWPVNHLRQFAPKSVLLFSVCGVYKFGARWMDERMNGQTENITSMPPPAYLVWWKHKNNFAQKTKSYVFLASLFREMFNL